MIIEENSMGLFDLFKKKEKAAQSNTDQKTGRHNTPNEKGDYQPEEYYTDVVAEGTAFEKRVISFEERKKTAIPSARGLYPAEILLLEYCSKGAYPGPKNGYPGFWWFEYGIRNVDVVLKNLEERGYIAFASAKESVNDLTVSQLKELLMEHGESTTGKKAELVARVSDTISEETLLSAGVRPKYRLTETGAQELSENAYVPYMHKAPNKTTEDTRFGLTFNVWSINKLLGSGDKSNWKKIVDEQERKINKEIADRNDAFMKDLKKIDPEGYRVLKTQDQQIEAVQKAKEKFNEDRDIDTYIAFWETLWKNGGLKFEGAGWHFELPDLYIKSKRYDDALAFVTKLKKQKPTYAHKADAYIKKIEELKAKQMAKKKN